MNSKDSEQPQSDVLLYVEQEAPSKFRIQSDQLERIGTKLRGPRQFSIFNSIVLPVIITIITTLLTGGFQYVSWTNSVRLQAATDIADKGSETYEKTAEIIGKRLYATLVFIPSTRDMARSVAPDVSVPAKQLSASADANFITGSISGAQSQNGLQLADVHGALTTKRFESYYENLTIWNETYEQILTEIDYNLDRPILLHADLTRTGVKVFNNKIAKVDCKGRLITQLKDQDLNSHSLKLQFATIHHCFRKIHSSLDGEISGVLVKSPDRFSAEMTSAINAQLGDLRTMANEFRCYALRRVDYYRRQKERAILGPELIWRRIFRTRQEEARRHFKNTDDRCSPENRPT